MNDHARGHRTDREIDTTVLDEQGDGNEAVNETATYEHITDETPAEENLEYAQFDPQQLDQLMSEGLSDEDLPSMSLPRKGPGSEAGETVASAPQTVE